MEYVKAARTADFSAVSKIRITLKGNDILLVKFEGDYYAIANKCPHMGGSLYDGRLEGSNIVCPRHGSVFDIKTGKTVGKGKLLFVKFSAHSVISYPVKTEGEDILIGIE